MAGMRRQAVAQLIGLVPAISSGPGLAQSLICRRLAAAAHAGSGAAASPVAHLTPGAVLTLTKRFTVADVARFVALTGDTNPIHVDPAAAARQAGVGTPILPGMLVASLFPAIIGSNFPGALYLSQTLKFKQYAPVGDSYTATLTVQRSSGSRVSFFTVARNAATDAVVVEGTALALIKQRQ